MAALTEEEALLKKAKNKTQKDEDKKLTYATLLKKQLAKGAIKEEAGSDGTYTNLNCVFYGG